MLKIKDGKVTTFPMQSPNRTLARQSTAGSLGNATMSPTGAACTAKTAALVAPFGILSMIRPRPSRPAMDAIVVPISASDVPAVPSVGSR